MKLPISEKALGVIAVDGVPVVSSRDVADIFEKRHDNVLRDIQGILLGLLKIEESDLGRLNFKESFYKNEQNKKQPEYLLTRDGFTLLAMGFTGAKAMRFKVAYINRFNEMEQFIRSRYIARLEYPELTNMIKIVFDNPEWHYYSNEADMINRIVLGMSSKEFREANDIPKDASIRDYMSPRQAELIQKLQNFDIGLVATIPEFQERKKVLRAYCEKLHVVPKLTA
ncbi:Rha family transcriptional regulator [Anaeroselena agilis]|uniref:Rha family transcriptional regulator n=1 Tax=Anaeroselena agilis TaxID=3063788 RepID=A0ABU3NYF5_9FIRM|nr:Rha family transcriptional regulator [Selenomonadales bacterium 4137-cl]